jgi:hypothetical protein
VSSWVHENNSGSTKPYTLRGDPRCSEVAIPSGCDRIGAMVFDAYPGVGGLRCAEIGGSTCAYCDRASTLPRRFRCAVQDEPIVPQLAAKCGHRKVIQPGERAIGALMKRGRDHVPDAGFQYPTRAMTRCSACAISEDRRSNQRHSEGTWQALSAAVITCRRRATSWGFARFK